MSVDRRTLLIAGGTTLSAATLWWLTGSGDEAMHADTEASIADFRSRKPEGGRIILDPARVPTTYQEAPMLTAHVKSGKLPPVRQRVGLDPIVVEPLHAIGRYGGTLRRAFVGPGDSQGVTRFASGPDSLLYWDHEWKTLRPNIARSFEVSADGRETILKLRRGMRWSDGALFTADDIMFWFEDMYGDRRVVAAPSATLRVDGQDVLIEKIDAETVRFVSPNGYAVLAEVLAGYSDIGGPSVSGRSGLGGFAPKHYLSPFHPKYASEEKLTRDARAAGFANWAIHLKSRNDWTLNTRLPVVSPWRTVQPINTQAFVLERNPYSVWVDTEGNQLPYLDRVSHTHCSGPDAVNFKAVAGKLDFQDRHLYVSKLPFLLNGRERSQYDVFLDPFEGTDLGLRVNLAYREDPEIGALLANVAFRRALSLGIDRAQINETFLLGTGIPSSAVPSPDNRYYPGAEWATRWARHDPSEANRLLDGLGLTARDSEGFRKRKDGSRLRLTCNAVVAHFDYPAVAEMVRHHWRAIGVDLDVQIAEITLWLQRAMSGSIQLAMMFTGSEDPFTFPDLLFPCTPVASGALMGLEFARWFQSNGVTGTRPPDDILAIMELWRQGRSAAPDERIRIGQELIRRHVDQVLSIGLISAGLAQYGIHIAKRNLGNVPRRFVNTHVIRAPANALPMTFYFKDPIET